MSRFICTLIIIMTLTALSPTSSAENAAAPYRHVVCFKFKESATPADIAKIEKAFGKLPTQIDSVTDYEWGTNVSPENHAQGYTHCFIVSFADRAGLDKYIPHAAHKSFVELLLPSLDQVFVIDFVAK